MFATVLAAVVEKVAEHVILAAAKRTARLMCRKVHQQHNNAPAVSIGVLHATAPEFRMIGTDAEGVAILVPAWMPLEDGTGVEVLYRDGSIIRCRKRDASGSGKWRQWTPASRS